MAGLFIGSLFAGFVTFTEFVPAKTRGKWSSTLSLLGNCAPPLATLIGYLVMTAFGSNYGWRAMFIIAGVAAVVLWFARHDSAMQ